MNMLQKEVQRIKLNDLCHVVTKGTTPTSVGLAFSDCGIPFLRIQNLSNKTISLKNVLFIDEKTHNTLKRSVIKPRDFLITIAGTIGKVAIVPDEFPESNCNQAIAILRFDNAKLHPEYLFHWLHTQDALQQITGKKVTATISNLSLGQIKNLEIPLPPLTQQKQIAAILDAADSLRQKDQQLVEHYTALSQSLFLEMFGDPDTNPMGWECRTLNELVSKLGDGLHGTPTYSEEGEYYFINGNNLQNGVIQINSQTKKVSSEEFNKHKKELNESTMLVSINGTIGKVAFYRGENIVLGKSACYFNVQETLINKIFLYRLIESPYFIKYASGLATGSTIKNVSLKTMRNFPVPTPPKELQNQFAERIAIIEQQKQQAQSNLQKSEALFNSLLQRAFTGELTADKAA